MRINGWEKAFAEFLRDKTNQPQQWGENDCILFAAKGIEVITGINFYQKYLPYSSEEEAAEIIKRHDGMIAMISRALGNPHDNFLRAKRGDLVLMRLPEETIGLVDDSGQRIACVSHKGLTRKPLKQAALIWSY